MSEAASILGHEPVDRAIADSLASNLRAWLETFAESPARKPAHRVKLRWPPPPVSRQFHVLSTDWRGDAVLELHGERLPVKVARNPHGVFGRCDAIWLEVRGDNEAEMLQAMRKAAEPFFKKSLSISAVLGREGRFRGQISNLDPLSLLKLLFAEDRDIADDAQAEIERHARTHLFVPALNVVLADERHPWRRSAQWCVLDMYEELPSLCRDAREEQEAVQAMKALMWDAKDDYARTMFKAGVVIGGHLSETYGGPILIECLKAPSRIARRSAIHGLFHVVEWVPELRSKVVAALEEHAAEETDSILKTFARQMARDIESESAEHVPEPVFPGE